MCKFCAVNFAKTAAHDNYMRSFWFEMSPLQCFIVMNFQIIDNLLNVLDNSGTLIQSLLYNVGVVMPWREPKDPRIIFSLLAFGLEVSNQFLIFKQLLSQQVKYFLCVLQCNMSLIFNLVSHTLFMLFFRELIIEPPNFGIYFSECPYTFSVHLV